MMAHEWFKTRGYKHFDASVGEPFANGKASIPSFVRQHSWLPLIHYVKGERRYKPLEGRTVFKNRDIMYASHRDACILSRYAFLLTQRLDAFYEENGLCDHVIAYRKLGKANYDFSAEAYRFSLLNAPCVVSCFDITGFFDNLDHAIIKQRLKRVLGVSELTDDWYKVLVHVTRFKRVELEDLKSHTVFGQRLKAKGRAPIATIAELKSARLTIHENKNAFGIPQGTPISSALSNLYMIELDKIMSTVCNATGSLYQRYSDDILLVCQPHHEAAITKVLFDEVLRHKLKIKDAKTERVEVHPDSTKTFQYLGFNASPTAVTIRPNSLARQWRKAKRNLWRTRKIGEHSIATGKSSVIYTKKLRLRLSPVGTRNFSSYARRSAKAFKSKQILRQALRLERMIDKAIAHMKLVRSITPP